MHCTTRCSKLYDDFWEETGGDTRTHNLSLTGSHKVIFLHMFWRVLINLKTFVHTHNLAFVHTYTFRMKSSDSFILDATGDEWIGAVKCLIS